MYYLRNGISCCTKLRNQQTLYKVIRLLTNSIERSSINLPKHSCWKPLLWRE